MDTLLDMDIRVEVMVHTQYCRPNNRDGDGEVFLFARKYRRAAIIHRGDALPPSLCRPHNM